MTECHRVDAAAVDQICVVERLVVVVLGSNGAERAWRQERANDPPRMWRGDNLPIRKRIVRYRRRRRR